MQPRLIRGVLFVLLCAGLFGCSGGTTIKITGKVTFNGSPVEAAEVKFYPIGNPKVADFVGITKEDGTFEIKIPPSQKYTPGQYLVTVVKYVPRKGSKIQ